jgi:hypothetical protein
MQLGGGVVHVQCRQLAAHGRVAAAAAPRPEGEATHRCVWCDVITRAVPGEIRLCASSAADGDFDAAKRPCLIGLSYPRGRAADRVWMKILGSV